MELVVVLLVMGIVAAAAVPSFYASLQHHELETAARRVMLDLEQIRRVARARSETETLAFVDDTTYTLSGGIANLDDPDEVYTVDLAGPPYDLDDVTLNLGGATSVLFDGYGNTTASGTIVLTRGNRTRTVTLDAASGSISDSTLDSAELD